MARETGRLDKQTKWKPPGEGRLHLAHKHSAFELPHTPDCSTDCRKLAAPGTLMECTLQLGSYAKGALTNKRHVMCDPSMHASTIQLKHYLKPVGPWPGSSVG